MSKKQLRKKFTVRDHVRIYRHKLHFEKGFTHKFTKELHKIHKILETSPTTYELLDLINEPVLGKFYSNELVRSEF